MEDTIYVAGVNDADNELFIHTDHYQQERDDDITGRPDFEPVEDYGKEFIPMEPEQRPACLQPLLASPVDLFQQFVPVSLVENWASYTNEAPESPRGPGPGSRNNSNYRKEPSRRGQKWTSTSVAEIYLWLAMQIYIGLYRESCLEDYWKVSDNNSHVLTHPIIKYMTFNRFQLLS
ncbi:hypothetical protein S40288_10171 [Stachybotrys chartarum IBT 40288]|nr:hypothetical protein S40288_10171 [Stachybotrys chartarum IBT 40288]